MHVVYWDERKFRNDGRPFVIVQMQKGNVIEFYAISKSLFKTYQYQIYKACNSIAVFRVKPTRC